MTWKRSLELGFSFPHGLSNRLEMAVLARFLEHLFINSFLVDRRETEVSPWHGLVIGLEWDSHSSTV